MPRKQLEHGDLAMYDKRGCRCDLCRSAKAAKQRAYTAKRRAEGTWRRYEGTEPTDCSRCGIRFEARADRARKYCSARCQLAAQRDKAGLAYGTRFYISDSRRARLHARDNFICHLCGLRADPTAPSQSDNYPTLDHLTPRSLGGDNTDENLSTAHRLCNSRRGNRLLEGIV